MSEGREQKPETNVYYVKKSKNQSIIYTAVEGTMELAKTLIDSGSSRNFINEGYVLEKGLTWIPLGTERSVIAIDGKEIQQKVTKEVQINIEVEGKTLQCRLYVMPLGDIDIILGKDWLEEADPLISWRDLSITYREEPIVGKAGIVEPEIPVKFQDFGILFQEEGFSELPEHRATSVEVPSLSVKPMAQRA
jgi:hypothetical protein